jgi:hypothetical protein
MKWPNIGEALENLRRNAEHALSHTAIDQSIAPKFTIQGWSWKTRANNRTIGYPLLCEIKLGPSSGYLTTYSGKYWAWDRSFKLQTNPDLEKEEIARLRNEIKTRGERSARDLQNVLIDSIRRASEPRPEVGKDVMCVLLTPRSSPTVRITYSPENSQNYYAHKTNDGRVLYGAYTPWIITRTSVWPPSATQSGWTDMRSSFTWSVVDDPILTVPPRLNQSPSSSIFSKLQRRPTYKPPS